jgi:diaminopimelate decarboxylase
MKRVMKHPSKTLIEPQYSFPYVKNELTVEGVRVSELVQKYGSPLYVYSGAAIRESYRRLSQSLHGLPLQICYAVKANSNIHLLKLLSSLGAGCDLVSYGEWCRAELAKVPRNRRVLSGVAKTAIEFDQLLEHDNAGVSSIHVESAMEFELILLMATLKQKKVTVAFRYNPDVDAQTLDKISTGRKTDKFGLTREEILSLCVAHADDEHVRIAGLSIHIGSQIVKTAPYEKAFRILKKLAEEVELHLGRVLDYVDLGGGIGVQYQAEKTISLVEYAALVKKYFSKYKKILIEPGRSLVANAGILVTEVVYSKVRPDNRTLILDSGMNDLVRPALYGAYHQIVPVQPHSDLIERKWDVVGGICETTDYFARGRKLAVEGLPGEQVAFLSAGAYGFSMSSTYNSRPRVAEVLVDQGKVKLIRKRETIADLVQPEIS